MSYRAIILAVLMVCLSPQVGMAQAGAGQSEKATPAVPSTSPEQAKLLKSAEAFVRVLFGWGPDVKVKPWALWRLQHRRSTTRFRFQ